MAEKTEKPTQKKLRDSARKGQTFKSRDIVAVCVLAAGALAVDPMVDLRRIMAVFVTMASTGTAPDPHAYALAWGKLFLSMVFPFILICAVAGTLPSLVQSRFTLAVEAIKLDLTAISPMKGLKKIFNVKSLKEAVKALLYVAVFVATVWTFAGRYARDIFSLVYARPDMLARAWITLSVQLILRFLLCALPVLVFDAFFEYFHYFKQMRMDKDEVKKEYKESEGNPEIKGKRREVHQEILSEEVKANVEQSDFMLANPTHIAIGIYMNPDITPVPFVSVRETNARALAVIRYAESKGVPVVRDIPLARSVYRNSPRRYSFVSSEDLDRVMRVLIWLLQVEAVARDELKAPGEEDVSPDTLGDAEAGEHEGEEREGAEEGDEDTDKNKNEGGDEKLSFYATKTDRIVESTLEKGR